jgi:hypothetical protein
LIGAAVGSVIPGAGTVIGAILGAVIVGAGAGLIASGAGALIGRFLAGGSERDRAEALIVGLHRNGQITADQAARLCRLSNAEVSALVSISKRETGIKDKAQRDAIRLAALTVAAKQGPDVAIQLKAQWLRMPPVPQGPSSPTLKATPAAIAAMKPQPPASDRLVQWGDLRPESQTGEKEQAIQGLLGAYRGSVATQAGREAVEQARRILDQLELKAGERPEGFRAKAVDTLQSRIEAERSLLEAVAKKLPDLPPEQNVTLGRLIEMERVGMPLAALADIAMFNEQQEVSRTPLRSGLIGSVDRVQYQPPGSAPKAYKTAAARLEGLEHGWAKAIGIAGRKARDPRPRLANRNVATWLVDQELKLNLVPETHFAANGDEVGLVMDWAPGEAAMTNVLAPLTQEDVQRIAQAQHGDDPDRDIPGVAMGRYAIDDKDQSWKRIETKVDVDTTDPDLLRALSDLEWLDKITGQVDRNPGNYLIEKTKQGKFKKLTAIDNDFAFGSEKPDPANLTEAHDGTMRPRALGS